MEDWLGGCVPWNGTEKDLPAGVIGLPPGVFAEDLVKSVVIFDDGSETGLREVRPSELKKGDKIASCKMWEERVAAIGEAGIRIIDPDTGAKLTRVPGPYSWYDSPGSDGKPRHTDGLALQALKKLRMKLSGPGVHLG